MKLEGYIVTDKPFVEANLSRSQVVYKDIDVPAEIVKANPSWLINHVSLKSPIHLSTILLTRSSISVISARFFPRINTRQLHRRKGTCSLKQMSGSVSKRVILKRV